LIIINEYQKYICTFVFSISISIFQIHVSTLKYCFSFIFQFIISRDGNCGLNYEHSVAEGIAVVRLIEHILQYMKEVKRWKLVRFPSVCELAYPRRMKWNLDNNSKSMIDYALNEIDK
uniref:Carn_acyltransf domain-containing protein n=1 Tax=Schistosoma curassoni TaxID=6186 RepID=A0A183JRM7_9TREM